MCGQGHTCLISSLDSGPVRHSFSVMAGRLISRLVCEVFSVEPVTDLVFMLWCVPTSFLG